MNHNKQMSSNVSISIYASEIFTFLAQIMCPYGMTWQMGAPPGLVPRRLKERCSGFHLDVSVWQAVTVTETPR
jgi:hypothetical protein